MSYFDGTDLWMGDSEKANAKIRLDAANSTITVASGGEITNSGGDYRLTDDGIQLDKGTQGKPIAGDGSLNTGKALTWDFDGDDKAAHISAYTSDSTPTLSDSELWILAGYDSGVEDGFGTILMEAGDLEVNVSNIDFFGSQGKIEFRYDTTSLSSGDQSITVTEPVMVISSANSDSFITNMSLDNESLKYGMQITILNNSSVDFGFKDTSGGNIQTPKGNNMELLQQSMKRFVYYGGSWFPESDHGA